MIESIQRFISILRQEGIRIAPSEAIDAARAVAATGIERRDLFRLALRATLIKSHRDLATFDRGFDSFFHAPKPRRAGSGSRPQAEGAGKGRRAVRTEGLPVRPRPPLQERPAGRFKTVLSSRGKDAERAAWRKTTADPRPSSPRRPAPARRPRGGAPAAAPDPRRVELAGPVAAEDEERLAREIPRIVSEIRLKSGRRYRESARGRPWPARAPRRSLATQGVPFVIPSRRRRPREPRLVVLADVSWSVMRASALFLMLAREFVEIARRVSVHLFVDRCVEVTAELRRWDARGVASFSRWLESIPDVNPRAPSDYGRAFHQAAHGYSPAGSAGGAMRIAGRETILVVLGDARNNFNDPQEWAFEDLANRCRRVIWLVPEPAPLWNTGDSVLSTYLPSCDLLCEANDLEGLARGVAAIVRTL